jgi:hypothetical protein
MVGSQSKNRQSFSMLGREAAVAIIVEFTKAIAMQTAIGISSRSIILRSGGGKANTNATPAKHKMLCSDAAAIPSERSD